ncbi:hypothetical protein HNQ59_001860 [Chitinivorax tropicus]|uniref:DUF6881 domain-containing protein n=1 Tax=Chitinivorax tropicus TaxID=714531 RepID=A0A840MTP3_9PROT|nr:hypothetical protein [Chitinivorax tropicus]
MEKPGTKDDPLKYPPYSPYADIHARTSYFPSMLNIYLRKEPIVKHLKIKWNHHFADEPILLYSELNDDSL